MPPPVVVSKSEATRFTYNNLCKLSNWNKSKQVTVMIYLSNHLILVVSPHCHTRPAINSISIAEESNSDNLLMSMTAASEFIRENIRKDFLVVGGAALTQYGSTRNTRDVDIGITPQTLVPFHTGTLNSACILTGVRYIHICNLIARDDQVRPYLGCLVLPRLRT